MSPDLAGLVRRIRRTADLSQRELAARTGLSKTTIAAALAVGGDGGNDGDGGDTTVNIDQDAKAEADGKNSYAEASNTAVITTLTVSRRAGCPGRRVGRRWCRSGS